MVVVCSAPLTMVDEKKRSLTDVILGIGKDAVNGNNIDFSIVEKPYLKILDYVNDDTKNLCKEMIDDFLKKSNVTFSRVKTNVLGNGRIGIRFD